MGLLKIARLQRADIASPSPLAIPTQHQRRAYGASETRYCIITPFARCDSGGRMGHRRPTITRRFGDALLLQRRSMTARAVTSSVNRQRRGHAHAADAPRSAAAGTLRQQWRNYRKKSFVNQNIVVTLRLWNRFALHGVRLKGNAVRTGDSTRCCDSRRTWATISHCKPSERLREGMPTGRDKSEDLPVSEKLHNDAFGS